jgi:hypothetical protein
VTPISVTVTIVLATVTLPIRVVVELLGAAVTITVPLPVPVVGLTTVQDWFDEAVQVQVSETAVTVMFSVDPV